MRRLLFVCFWCVLLFALFTFPVYSLDDLPPGSHCIGMTTDGEPESPFYASWQFELPPPEVRQDPKFPGCTWGAVYYRGQPVRGAQVTLRFGSQTAHTRTYHYFEQEGPFYSMTAADLGAKHGDLLTLVVEFAGQRFERTFRAQPDLEGEQQVAVALEEIGVWSVGVRGAYTNTFAVVGDTLWAGGVDGLVAVPPQGAPQERTPDWRNPIVRALAVDLNGDVWAVGPSGVAQWKNGAWRQHTLPVAGYPHDLSVDPTTGDVWVMSDQYLEQAGPTAVSIYDGGWRTIGATLLIRGLAIDGSGDAWAATFGGGLFRRHGGRWAWISSDSPVPWYMTAARVQENPRRSVWLSSWPRSTTTPPECPVVQYDVRTGTWRCFTVADGLTGLKTLPSQATSVHALEIDSAGTVYAGTHSGVYMRVAESQWANIWPGGDEPVRALALVGEDVAIAASSAVYRLDRSARPGEPPQAAIEAPDQISPAAVLVLSGAAVDRDEQGGAIVAWDWRSDLDGPLCTSKERCVISASRLRRGAHHISLRVLDDEGMWSPAATVEVQVLDHMPIYLPAVLAAG